MTEYSFWNNDIDRYLVINMAERCHGVLATHKRHVWTKMKVLEIKEKYSGLMFVDKHFNQNMKSNRFSGVIQQWEITKRKGQLTDTNVNLGIQQKNATRSFKKMLMLWMYNRANMTHNTSTLYEDMEYVYHWAVKMNWISAEKWTVKKLWDLYSTMRLNQEEIMHLETLFYDNMYLRDQLCGLYKSDLVDERLEFHTQVALLYSEFLKQGKIRPTVLVWELEKEILDLVQPTALISPTFI